MSVIGSNILAGASGVAGAAEFKIERSLRFNSGDSAYLSKTPTSAGNRRTWTWSGWIKRCSTGSYQAFFSSWQDSTNFHHFRFRNDEKFETRLQVSGSDKLRLITDQVFRDFSAWYHVVFAYDSTQSTASNRAKLYINGSQVTDFSTETYPSQNDDSYVANTTAHYIGQRGDNNFYHDGMMADCYLIDGSALSPTSFGAFDNNGVWQAAAYSGTYGTNGFHLDFSDNSSDAALGYDAAGSNNWTVNNLTATQGTAYQGFDVITYSGNGSSNYSIGGLGFQPDFVWIKSRDMARSHMLFDSVRGIYKRLYSNGDNSEDSDSSTLISFNSNGFTVNTNSAVNVNNENYVAWCWKAGGTASSNTDGTITSQVSANTDYGFSIVSYTGTGSSETVGHGLNAAPAIYIIKRRDASADWQVSTTAIDGSHDYLDLNNNIAKQDSGRTAPTSSVFSTGSGTTLNANGGTYIAYCWSEVSGFSKFGSYSGSGASGKTLTGFGFKARWILIKNTSAAQNWFLYDTKRGPDSANNDVLRPNMDSAELQSSVTIDFDADGITLNSSDAAVNASGNTYIYAAFAESPEAGDIDSLIDTPTDYEADSGNNGGNYCTMKPLDNGQGTQPTFSNGNLETENTGSDTTWASSRGTIGMKTGKYYFEWTNRYAGGGLYGIANAAASTNPVGTGTGGWTWGGQNRYFNGSSGGTGLSSNHAVGDVIQIAFDADTGKLWFGRNNTFYDSSWGTTGDPGAGTNNTTSVTTGVDYFPALANLGSSGASNADSSAFNAGQRPFTYTPPTGYVSLCTENLSDPTIADGSTSMDVSTWTGTDTSAANTITGLKFSPDLIWSKSRSHAYNNQLVDSVRGGNKSLTSNATTAEVTDEQYGYIDTFNSDGFTTTPGSGDNDYYNGTGKTYVAWAWDAGSSTVSNTDGGITSSVRVNQTAGFSIVTYTGVATANVGYGFGHGLGKTPEMVIIKNRDATTNWVVNHVAFGTSGNILELNSTGAQANGHGCFDSQQGNSTVVGIRNDSRVNANGDDYLALCFTSVAGYSAFGSYTGNGSSNGPFVYTGFRPAFILIKVYSGGTSNWHIFDKTRSSANAMNLTLFPDLSNAEATETANLIDALSNGFKVRGAGNGTNASSDVYIWAAFSEHPFKTARAR